MVQKHRNKNFIKEPVKSHEGSMNAVKTNFVCWEPRSKNHPRGFRGQLTDGMSVGYYEYMLKV